MDMKTCTKCHETKPLGQFTWRKDTRYSKGGYYTSRCSVCLSGIAKAWQQKNKERAYAAQAEWRDANRAQWNVWMAAAGKKRYCAKMQRVPKWANDAMTKAVYTHAGELRALGLDVDVDHIVPLQGELASGLHVHWNLQVVLMSDNRSKKNQVDFDAYNVRPTYLSL
jgi:hypothetical protein